MLTLSKAQIIRHMTCLLLSWVIGGGLTAGLIHILVGMGVEMDFTYLDYPIGVLVFVGLEYGWTYALNWCASPPA